MSIVIAELEPERVAKRATEPEEKPKSAQSVQGLGLVVADLTDAQKTELKLKGGVRVESLVEPALRAGLREGDVILAVGNIEVSQVKDFILAVGKLDKSKPISVLFRRGELTRYTLIRPNS